MTNKKLKRGNRGVVIGLAIIFLWLAIFWIVLQLLPNEFSNGVRRLFGAS